MALPAVHLCSPPSSTVCLAVQALAHHISLRPLHRVRQLARMLLGSAVWRCQCIAGPVCLLLAKSALAHRKHGRCRPLRQARATNFSLQTVSSSSCRLQKHYNKPPQLSQLMSSQINSFRASCTHIPNSSEQPSNSANLFETSSCSVHKHFFLEPWDGSFGILGPFLRPKYAVLCYIGKDPCSFGRSRGTG